MTFTDAKQRFSKRVADYVRYRPGYPSEVLELLRSECGLRPGHVDRRHRLRHRLSKRTLPEKRQSRLRHRAQRGHAPSRRRISRLLRGFASINGSAEATTLDDASVDFITAGQAFHWFEPDAARREFLRILKPDGWIVVLWNERQRDTPFATRVRRAPREIRHRLHPRA